VEPFQPFNRQKACRYGQMLYNPNDKYVGRSLDLYGEYSEGEVELFRQTLQPGSVVIEVGANMGALTLPLAQIVSKTGIVIAFEPQRIIYQTLCANLALNSVPNVYAFQQAIGAGPGAVFVPALDYTQENNFGGLALGNFETGERVPVASLDDFNFPACHFLKVDVEGMELDVLRGANRLIGRYRPIIYVENDRKDKSDELVRHLHSLDYKMYWHRPYYYNPDNFFHNPENVFPNTGSLNMICVHRDLSHDLRGVEPVEDPTG